MENWPVSNYSARTSREQRKENGKLLLDSVKRGAKEEVVALLLKGAPVQTDSVCGPNYSMDRGEEMTVNY